MKVYQKIKLPFDPFEDLDLSKYADLDDQSNLWHLKNVTSVELGPKLTKFLSDLNLDPVDRSCFFIGNPMTIQTIHTDGHQCEWALNFVKNWEDSSMRWYTLKDGISLPPMKQTDGNNLYRSYSPSQLKWVASETFENALVRINMPHHCVNLSTKQRYCFSVRVKNAISWEDALEMFKPWFIE